MKGTYLTEVGSKYKSISCLMSWELMSQDTYLNRSTIRIYLTIRSTYGSYNSPYSDLTINRVNVHSGYLDIPKGDSTAGYRDIVILHNDDGTFPNIEVNASVYSHQFNPEKWMFGTIKAGSVPSIPRYASCSHSLSWANETSVGINWASDSTIDKVWYKIFDGPWVAVSSPNSSSGSYTIYGLSPNYAYTITTCVRRKDSQLETNSSAISVATYDYPHLISAPSFYIGDVITISLYNPLRRNVNVKLIGADGSIIGDDDTSSSSITGYSGLQDGFYKSIPNSKSGTYSVKVTYGSVVRSSAGGSYSVKESAALPTVGAASYKDINSSTVAITQDNQRIIQANSTVEFTVGSASAQKYATISKYEVNCNDKTVTIESPGTINFGSINVAENTKATITAIDSRGFRDSREIELIVDAWRLPTALIDAHRRNNFYPETTIKVDSTCSSLNGKNTLSITEYHKRVSEKDWSPGMAMSDNVAKEITLDSSSQWNLKFVLQDRIGKTTYYMAISRGVPLAFFDRFKNSVGINCMPSKDKSLEVDGISIKDFAHPIGSIYFSSVDANPTNMFGGIWEPVSLISGVFSWKRTG